MKLAHSIKFLLAGTALVVAGFAAANAIGNAVSYTHLTLPTICSV